MEALNLQDPMVRDLASLMLAPGLLEPTHPMFRGRLIEDSWCRSQLASELAGGLSLRSLDRDPTPLHEWIQASTGASVLLGRYFEALLAFWIQYILAPTAFRQGTMVRRLCAPGANETLGELDLLFIEGNSEDNGVGGDEDEVDDKDNADAGVAKIARHWEASVKFMLCVGEFPDQADPPLATRLFVGPRTRDRLDLKIKKLFEHQLPLAQSPQARAALHGTAFENAKIESLAFMRGMLFYPSDRDWRNHPYPEEISSRHQRGWWTHAGELHLPTSQPGSRFCILPKFRWLSPAIATHAETLSREGMIETCREVFSESTHPLMIAELGPRTADDPLLHELSRGFVVHEGWPAQARLASVSADPKDVLLV